MRRKISVLVVLLTWTLSVLKLFVQWHHVYHQVPRKIKVKIKLK